MLVGLEKRVGFARYNLDSPRAQLQLLGGGMEYSFVNLGAIDALRFFIDDPKEGQNVDAARTKISGWIYSDAIAKLTFVVESKSVLRRVEINQSRADASRHLKEKIGVAVKTDTHGFSKKIPYSDEFKLGFDLGNGPIWVRKITTNKANIFDEYASIELLGSGLR